MNGDTAIVIAVLNARYSHTALGPRYLLANLAELRPLAVLEEFVIQDDLQRIAEKILFHHPKLVALSLSIWNASPTRHLIELLRRIEPDLSIVTGGPELRWAAAPPPGADVLVRGEGEGVFADVCRRLLRGENVPPVIDGGHPDLAEIVLPYGEYRDEDLRQRIVYVETSRGCPFGCEFCLSSREEKVRFFPIESVLHAFGELLDRGCRGFKFIDRTFNLDTERARRVLDFFHERWPRDVSGGLVPPVSTRQAGLGSVRNESLFLHFEMVPDRFDTTLIESLSRFPPGGIQLEVGVQTLDPEAGERIGRRVDAGLTARNLELLKVHTGVHIHADLIAGLPGEGDEDLARSYDQLRAMGPHEIQIGILKLLPGAPIVRHAGPYSMVFNPLPPYDVLQTGRIGFSRMQELKRLSRFHDMFVNSGKFRGAMRHIMDGGGSAFARLDTFSRQVFDRTGQDHGISQNRQYELVLEFLKGDEGMDGDTAVRLLRSDYLAHGNPRYMPECLRASVDTGPGLPDPTGSQRPESMDQAAGLS